MTWSIIAWFYTQYNNFKLYNKSYYKLTKYTPFPISYALPIMSTVWAHFYLRLSEVSANERSHYIHYICNVFSHWLRPCLVYPHVENWSLLPSAMIWYCIQHSNEVVDNRSNIEHTKDTQYLTLAGKLSGPWFNIKMPSYQYRKSHCGDKKNSVSEIRWRLRITDAEPSSNF